jgi:branched-chain amino acid transport system substrate-binding protein
LLAEDDQADPKMGPVGVAQKLVDAKVAGVVGHFNSGVTIPASKVYSDAVFPQLSVVDQRQVHDAGVQDRVSIDGR